jgi:hypothetical protein
MASSLSLLARDSLGRPRDRASITSNSLPEFGFH